MLKIMDGVEISTISQANPDDRRGETWQWLPEESPTQIVVCKRKAGSISNHYHTGTDPSKSPECLFIASGKIKFTFRDRKTDELQLLDAEAGTAIYIRPNIDHKTEVLQDAVIIESRITLFNKFEPDTYPADNPAKS